MTGVHVCVLCRYDGGMCELMTAPLVSWDSGQYVSGFAHRPIDQLVEDDSWMRTCGLGPDISNGVYPPYLRFEAFIQRYRML